MEPSSSVSILNGSYLTWVFFFLSLSDASHPWTPRIPMESLSTVLMMIIIPTTVLRIFECESQWTESSWGGHPPHSFLFDITKKNMPRWDNSLADRQGVLEATIYSHSRLLKNCKLAQHFVLISLLRHKSSSNQIVRKIRSENLKNPFTLRAVEGERAWKRWIWNSGRAHCASGRPGPRKKSSVTQCHVCDVYWEC